MTAVSLPRTRVGTPAVPRWGLLVGLLVVAAILYVIFADGVVQPAVDDAPLFLALNDLRDLIRDNRDNLVFVILFGIPRLVIDTFVDVLTTILRTAGWPAILAGFAALGLLFGGRGLAMRAAIGIAVIGILGLWESGVDTMAAVVAAVSISFALGVPLGIAMAGSKRVRAVLTPILDVMQIMPTFAYLAPLVLFFGIGPASAVIVTLIYAMPAAIRITALGLRNVPVNTVEAGVSLGTTAGQLLRGVRLPLASKELALALNQTLMLAVSMIVITALIDAPGLGQDIIGALIRNDVGLMLDAGIAIVLLAIVLDRLTEALAGRLDPHKRAAVEARRLPRRIVVGILAVVGGLAIAGVALPALREFPDLLTVSVRGPVNAFVDWLRANVAWLTIAIKDAISYGLLNPIQTVMTTAPAWLVVGVTVGLGWIVSGLRAGIVAGLALAVVYLMSLWQDSMETLVQVIVATIMTLAIGVGLGIASARSDRFSRWLRPGLDIAQTLPSFVYILPAFVLFEAGRFTAIIAAVIFALPPVIRLVDVGIRAVPAAIVEAGTSSGATSRQLLTKVQLPVARPAIGLAINQCLILVLSMVVVGGLVGGQALGYNVVAGFARNELFGLGLASGVALVLLGIALDRLSRGTPRS